MNSINEKDKIPFDIHTEHHRWVEAKREEDKLSKDRVEKVKTSVVSSLVIAIILGLSSIVLEYFRGGK